MKKTYEWMSEEQKWLINNDGGGCAGKIWLAMAIIGLAFGCYFSTSTLVIITSIYMIVWGYMVLAFALKYGNVVFPNALIWVGVFLGPMWFGALIASGG